MRKLETFHAVHSVANIFVKKLLLFNCEKGRDPGAGDKGVNFLHLNFQKNYLAKFLRFDKVLLFKNLVFDQN